MSMFLIVEDEDDLAAFMVRGLAKQGYQAHVTWSGTTAVELALGGGFDLILLDVGLPDIDGFEVLKRIRAKGSQVPVIMLTARTSVADRVTGLEQGADDYVPKPFSFAELLARIRLRLRDTRQPEASLLTRGDLTLDLLGRHARITEPDGAREVELSAREFALAETFLRHPDQVLTRLQLLEHVWGYDVDPASNVVDVYVRYLRRKIGEDRIETVRGVGYRLR